MNFNLIVYDEMTGEINFSCYFPFVENYCFDFVAVAKLLRVHYPFNFQAIKVLTCSDDLLPSIDSRFSLIRPVILDSDFSFTFWFDFCCKLERVAYQIII